MPGLSNGEPVCVVLEPGVSVQCVPALPSGSLFLEGANRAGVEVRGDFGTLLYFPHGVTDFDSLFSSSLFSRLLIGLDLSDAALLDSFVEWLHGGGKACKQCTSAYAWVVEPGVGGEAGQAVSLAYELGRASVHIAAEGRSLAAARSTQLQGARPPQGIKGSGVARQVEPLLRKAYVRFGNLLPSWFLRYSLKVWRKLT